jgi:hypothetical protein
LSDTKPSIDNDLQQWFDQTSLEISETPFGVYSHDDPLSLDSVDLVDVAVVGQASRVDPMSEPHLPLPKL